MKSTYLTIQKKAKKKGPRLDGVLGMWSGPLQRFRQANYDNSPNHNAQMFKSLFHILLLAAVLSGILCDSHLCDGLSNHLYIKHPGAAKDRQSGEATLGRSGWSVWKEITA